MSAISTALAKANKPATPSKRLPFKDHYLKSGLFRVCIISLVVAAPIITLAVRASTPRPLVTVHQKIVVADVPSTVQAAPSPSEPKADLSADFQSLPINAIMATGNARVMMGSRVIRVGEEIIPGLKLVQIASDKLIAIDNAGAHYERGF